MSLRTCGDAMTTPSLGRVSGRDFEQTEERRAAENLFILIHSECGREVFLKEKEMGFKRSGS